ARARPVRSAHSIWELVLHIDIYLQVGFDATQGTPMPKLFGTERDWPALTQDSAEAWFDAQDSLFRNAEKLAEAVEKFDDSKLRDIAPGRSYDFYYLFHGVIQHCVYHSGQIAILKKAILGT